MEIDVLKRILLDGCESWEELYQKEERLARKTELLYKRSILNETDESGKKDLQRLMEKYQQAQKSEYYPQAAAIDRVKYNIAFLLQDKDLHGVIKYDNYAKEGTFSHHFIENFGLVLGDESKLVNMTYEELREKLYAYVGLECIPLKTWEEETLKSYKYEDNVKAGIHIYGGKTVAGSLPFNENMIDVLIQGIGMNEIYTKQKSL